MTTIKGVCDGGGPAITLPGIPTTYDQSQVVAQMMRRTSSLGFDAWWRRAQSVGYCAHPIQLVGTDHYGRERVVWARCNNRRASVCPSCSDLYARDTWQLVAAGTTGGRHNIPATVAAHPQVFATLTAPSFGAVHASTGSVCRDHRRIGEFRRCPHGQPLSCRQNHDHSDDTVGQPLCRDCYDYTGHVLFTWHLPELWRRFTIALRRAVSRKLKSAGIASTSVRVSFVKVVEMQARAIPHIHALIRLDPAPTASGEHIDHGPAATRGGGEPRYESSPAWQSPISATELAALIQHAARAVTLDVPNPPADNDTETSTVTVRFGNQIDTQPLLLEYAAEQDNSRARNAAADRLPPHRVAAYLAKYVTKSLQELGISARRLSGEAIADLDVTEHVRTILTTIDHLAKDARVLGIESLTGIGRWLHTLGYRGHITTKSRRYSITLGALRARRHQWTLKQIAADGEVSQTNTRAHQTTSEVHSDVCWQFDRSGHTSLGDRVLVLSAAHRHIETRRIGLSEYRRIRREGG
ncbi:replication initiator [Mycobacteroides abscessus]|uniref:replication initiator n=1 Tax=Mycobacteroides abscessus TaxID=36809 RepID=UPI000925D6A3|nr:replication initiator [Mycobacteroides abscessus]SHR37815.1 replication initiator protein [Mycobacteroides abscessus subsp. bolletii]SHT83112.1 replication initiator protein [Mycobacteroides abscessus subsp. bolletii]SHT87105.1 replication initiator protein [Mycobacteroides abscessus subsp. bolletii]SKH12030.1 replication initiator protein [Mycobacteroides abscessus subsp. bolletii]SKH50159.1 replication initiator protein [Mycobacteroides abscessus subsp. bolletii]